MANGVRLSFETSVTIRIPGNAELSVDKLLFKESEFESFEALIFFET